MRTQTTRAITGRVNADGTSATGGGFTSRRTALGSYRIDVPGSRLIAAVANASQGSVYASAYSFTDSSFVAAINTPGLVAQDAAFSFVAVVAA
jgi:hypothetical protein